MRKTTLSTTEVAALLNVTETTVKRWAESKRIPCNKTLGGHRKFLLSDIQNFAEKNSFPITGFISPPALTQKQMERLEFGLYSKNYSIISEIFLDEALQGDREGMEKLLVFLYRNQVSFINIIDNVVHPALVRIGILWEEGTIEVNQEHRASEIVKEAIIRLGSILQHQRSNNLSVVCTAVEGEHHDIGIYCIAYALEVEGWKLTNLGSNTPFDSLKQYIINNKPDLVCISATAPAIKKNEFLNGIKSIAVFVHSYGGKIVAGGLYANKFANQEIGTDLITYSVQDTIDYTKAAFNLKPGRKTNNKNI
jgi:MerR family transcriptional regulator, light-induced transcriptional regulator